MNQQLCPEGKVASWYLMGLVDKSILQACQNTGDKRAFYELYKACYHYMMGIIVRYSNGQENTEWLLNQCFAKVALNLNKYNPQQPFKSWMSRVVVNEILDHLRKQKRRNRYEVYGVIAETPQRINNRGEQNLLMEDMLKMLKLLPPQTQMVFNLFVMDGFKHSEIAEQLKISIGTSKWHLANARKLLKEMLLEQDRIPKKYKKSV